MCNTNSKALRKCLAVRKKSLVTMCETIYWVILINKFAAELRLLLLLVCFVFFV